MRRRDILAGIGAAAVGVAAAPILGSPARRQPNIVVVLADDLGYGDLGSYGARLIKTPHLDRFAAQGMRLTDFYASANVCTPSRAGLLTGRYPIRTGLGHGVILANDKRGLPQSEITIAEALKPTYKTALIGKWHLGHTPEYWPPTKQGFDVFFGLPYSHDIKPLALYSASPGVELTSEDVNFQKLTERFIDRGLRFIEDSRDDPFFLLLALTAPHVPLNPNPPFTHSHAGNYGDVVEEVDAGVGRLMATLGRLGLDRDTFVVVTSDNGPWFEGSTGALRARKGDPGWDGGYRVPFMARMPGVIPARQTSGAIGMNIDLMPTILALAGVSPPAGLTIDGVNLTSVLTGRNRQSPHEELVLFMDERVAGIRTPRWKLVGRSYYRGYDIPLTKLGAWLLFDLAIDPAESYNVAERHPEIVADMKRRFARAIERYEPLGVTKQAEKLPVIG